MEGDMSLGIFKSIFGKEPKELGSVKNIDRFVEQKLGHKLEVSYLHRTISSCRGSILPIESVDANEVIDAALSK